MLHLLTKEQVKESWDFIGPTIDAAIPPRWLADERVIGNIYRSAFEGHLKVWVYKEAGKDISGTITTRIIDDEISGIKYLHIYSINRTKEDQLVQGEWFKGFGQLKEYAKEKGCSHIVSYTRVPALVKKVQELGGNFDYYLFMEA